MRPITGGRLEATAATGETGPSASREPGKGPLRRCGGSWRYAAAAGDPVRHARGAGRVACSGRAVSIAIIP